jgi:hypothetical protein
MPSCNAANFATDTANHPNFTARLNNWKSANSCVHTLVSGDCLTEEEATCYSSYMLDQARSKLDADLTSVYQPDTATVAVFDSNYQTTMLTGLVWAALGTTVLYYAFTKI